MTEQIHWECRDITHEPNVPWEARSFEMVACLRQPASITRLYACAQFIGRDAGDAILRYAKVIEARLLR